MPTPTLTPPPQEAVAAPPEPAPVPRAAEPHPPTISAQDARSSDRASGDVHPIFAVRPSMTSPRPWGSRPGENGTLVPSFFSRLRLIIVERCPPKT